jgi:hypothetical protein
MVWVSHVIAEDDRVTHGQVGLLSVLQRFFQTTIFQ